MTTAMQIWLIAQTLVFAIWAIMMFRMLWLIARRKDGLLDGGGIGSQTNAFFGFFKDPVTRSFRIKLAVVTLVMIGLIAFGPLISKSAF